MPWYLKLFVALGGVSLVWHVVGSNARASIHSALGFVFHKFPGFAEFVRANRGLIVPILRDVEGGAEDAVDEIQEQPSALPPAGPPPAP